jgi:hypothetical protein
VAALTRPGNFNRGQLDAEAMGPAHGRSGTILVFQVEIWSGLAIPAEARMTVYGVERLLPTPAPRTLHGGLFGNSTHVLS